MKLRKIKRKPNFLFEQFAGCCPKTSIAEDEQLIKEYKEPLNTLKTFETERLFLKPTTIEDAGFILELFNTPKWLQFIGDRNVNSEEDARVYIKSKMLPQQEVKGFSNYTVIRKEDRLLVGSCGLYDREGMEGIDIGFAFLPQFEKKGYGYEAANEIMRAAKEDFGITTIKAITAKENYGSQNLLEKLGLSCTGTITLPGEDEELLLYEEKL